MTQEEKQLLLRDICARLPYEVRIAYKENKHDIHHWTLCTLHAPHISKDSTIIDTGIDGWIEYVEYPGAGMSTCSRPLHLEKMLPYLRLMSSMTEEEKEELRQRFCYDWEESVMELYYSIEIRDIDCFIDWLNEHHFDYRGLVEKGLALEAPNDMYKND